MSKQYADRDIEQLDVDGNYYAIHMNALTAEDLVSKSNIAAELAYRDSEIEALKAEAEAQAKYITQLMAETGDSLMKQKQAEAERDRLREAICIYAVEGLDTNEIGEYEGDDECIDQFIKYSDSFKY